VQSFLLQKSAKEAIEKIGRTYFFGGVLVLERFVSSVELKATFCNMYI